MRTQKKLLVTAILAGLTALPTLAMAQAKGPDMGWYVGGSIGTSEANGSCPPGFSCDFKDTAFKIFGGYRMSKNLAVEGFYGNWGEIKISTGAASAKAESSTFGIDAVGILPLSPQFDLFGKLGLGYTNIDATGTAGGSSASASDSGSDVHYGIGAAFHFNRNLSVRAEWEKMNDSDIDILSIGVQYRF